MMSRSALLLHTSSELRGGGGLKVAPLGFIVSQIPNPWDLGHESLDLDIGFEFLYSLILVIIEELFSVFVGSTSVGKTALIQRYATGEISEYMPTIMQTSDVFEFVDGKESIIR